LNIGIESNGKGKEFARPVLILKKHNRYSCLVVSLTTKAHQKLSYYQIDKKNHPDVYANLSQIRVMDSKRLISKMFFLGQENFIIVKNQIRKFNSL